MEEMSKNVVYDPRDLVINLADEIGIDQLYAIARDIRGEEGEKDYVISLKKQIREMRAHIEYLKEDKAMKQGEINGLKFAIRCNGVSGNEVN